METIFRYNGNPITFRKNGEIWINATEMARPFGKRPAEWQRLPSTVKLISAFRAMGKSHSTNDVIITESGSAKTKNLGGGATWLHRKLAISFAMWLSDDFHLWVLDHIEELMDKGITTLDSISKKDLAKMLYESEVEKERLQALNEENNKMIVALYPKAHFANTILECDGDFTMNELVKQLRIKNEKGKIIGYKTFFKMLRRDKFIDQYNRPYQEHVTAGILYMKPKKGYDRQVRSQLMTNIKGVEFFNNFYNPQNDQLQLMLTE